jgi:hypothetical protein
MWIVINHQAVPVVPNGKGVRLVNTHQDELLLCSALDLIIAARREGLYPEEGINISSSPCVTHKEMEVAESEGHWLPTTWAAIAFGGSNLDLDYYQKTVDKVRTLSSIV